MMKVTADIKDQLKILDIKYVYKDKGNNAQFVTISLYTHRNEFQEI